MAIFPRLKFILLTAAIALASVFFSGAGQAQSNSASPSLPPPLQSMAEQGAQIRYLGKHSGLDGWIMIKGGQEQFFYVLPGGEAFLMGVLFDKDGKIVTAKQIQDLRQGGDGEFLDLLANKPPEPTQNTTAARMEFKSPSEQLFHAVENSNWVGLGNDSAPAIYSFIDPQCPHCHAFIQDMSENISRGDVQIRAIPVGFKSETRAQAAFLLVMPDPAERLFRHMAGDDRAIPVLEEINQQGVQRNLSIMQTWKLNVTPLTVYKSASGKVKIVQGRAKDIGAILKDLK